MGPKVIPKKMEPNKEPGWNKVFGRKMFQEVVWIRALLARGRRIGSLMIGFLESQICRAVPHRV
jgi:hypothetical protein